MACTVLRRCQRCADEKPETDFWTELRPSGVYVRPNCKACENGAQRERYQRNRTRYRATANAGRYRNWERDRFNAAAGYARKRGATEFLSFSEWQALRRSTVCHWCGCALHQAFTNIDHVRPLSWGGQHTSENVVLSCANCNMRREWERKYRGPGTAGA